MGAGAPSEGIGGSLQLKSKLIDLKDLIPFAVKLVLHLHKAS